MSVSFIDTSYGRGGGVGRDLAGGVLLGVGVGLGVAVGVSVGVGLGGRVAVAVAVGVGVGGVNCAQYLPPVLVVKGAIPPQMIISVPVHTAV